MVAAEGPLAKAIADRTGADPRGDLHPHVLAAAVMAAVRTATEHWTTGNAPLPDLISEFEKLEGCVTCLSVLR
jgi:hypothetical protein